MFERFTDRARRVVVLAQEESRLLNHDRIGTEHILLGLIHEGEGVAAQALAALDVSLADVRSQVEEIIGRGIELHEGHLPFTQRAKRVFELSLREALQLGHNYIGTEHILLGLIREGEGVAAQVLVKLGADLSRVRQQVIRLLPAPEPTERPPVDLPADAGQAAIDLMNGTLSEAQAYELCGVVEMVAEARIRRRRKALIRSLHELSDEDFAGLSDAVLRRRPVEPEEADRPPWWHGHEEASQSFLQGMGVDLTDDDRREATGG